MKQRIFIAVKTSPRLEKEVIRLQNKYKNLPVRWIAPKNLHITLIPPWYSDNISGVIETIQNTCALSSPIGLSFHTVEFGPSKNAPRLIWASGQAPRELINLKRCLEKTLGIKEEKRSFLLHLTLARFRPESFSSFPIKSLSERVEWTDTISSFVLMESRLSRTGADYEVLHEF